MLNRSTSFFSPPNSKVPAGRAGPSTIVRFGRQTNGKLRCQKVSVGSWSTRCIHRSVKSQRRVQWTREACDPCPDLSKKERLDVLLRLVERYEAVPEEVLTGEVLLSSLLDSGGAYT